MPRIAVRELAVAGLVLALAGAGEAGAPSRAHSLASRLLGARHGMALAMELDGGRLLLRLDRREHAGPAPMGSLVKPFTLLAWWEGHSQADAPVVHCPPGGPPSCWYPPGHGNLDLEGALGRSCNAWFRTLARATDPARVSQVLEEYGLPGLAGERLAAMVGTEALHRAEPQAVLEAYAALLGGGSRFRAHPTRPVFLARHRPPPDYLDALRRGLAASAREGTGRHAGEALEEGALLCKTGTAARLDSRGRRDPLATTGWFVGVLPEPRPGLAVLAIVERGTGSKDAAPLGAELVGLLRRPSLRRR